MSELSLLLNAICNLQHKIELNFNKIPPFCCLFLYDFRKYCFRLFLSTNRIHLGNYKKMYFQLEINFMVFLWVKQTLTFV